MGSDGTHCTQCADYERRVMARSGDEPVPDDLRPCQAFVASPAFQEWAVERMRREVAAQVSRAGLDRMSMLKAKPDAANARERFGRAGR